MTAKRLRRLATQIATSTIVLATGATGARAENDPAAASALFEEASKAAAAKDFGTCVEKASAAWDKFQHAQTRALQGMCEVELGKYAIGATHLADYVRTSASDVEKSFADAFARARERVAELNLACEPKGATLYVDGAAVGMSPATVFVDPGDRLVGAKKEGYAGNQKRQVFAAGSVTAVTIVLDPVEKRGTPSEPFPAWPGIVGLAAGGAAAAVGIGLLVAAGAEGAAIEEDGKGLTCDRNAPTGRCATLRDDLEARDTMGNVGLGVLISGIVVFGAGAILTTVAAGSGGDEETSAFHVTPMIGAVNGVRFDLRF